MTPPDPIAERIPPSKAAIDEATEIAHSLMRNLELSELPLVNAALKATRLARLLNDFDYQQVFEYEVSGYPTTPTGVAPKEWRLCGLADRQYAGTSVKDGKPATFAYTDSIGALEDNIRTSESALAAAVDRSVSITSANPNQFLLAPPNNSSERQRIRTGLQQSSQRLAARRAFIYRYALQKYYELRFSGSAEDAFSRVRARVDATIGSLVPTAVQRFAAVYDNLRSENPEDWSNAVHSCRRILQDVADALFPPQATDAERVVGRKKITIKLGADQYVNRLIAWVERKADSERFKEIVGAQLSFLGHRLDAVFHAAQKGSHSTIVERAEADRYVVYTYMIVGDLLSLSEPEAPLPTSQSAEAPQSSE